MITASFNNIKIAGIAAAVPTKCVQAHEYDEAFGEDVVSKNIQVTGIKQAYQLAVHQTPSDLAYVAAKKLIEKKAIDPKQIGVLIYVSPYLDYIVPPTACSLHGRLGLTTDSIAFDLTLGCSGFVYGLSTIYSLLMASSAKYGLLLTSDTGNIVLSPLDRSRLLFGAGGTATLVEKTSELCETHVALRTDGTRFDSIIIPAGGYRHPQASHERTLRSDGNIRSDYDSFVNGVDVFSFSMTDVPRLALDFFQHYNYSAENFDAFVFHQANFFIIQRLMKKLKISEEKVPISLDRYGNTSASSIPLTICDAYAGHKFNYKFFIYGFGLGLSWACASLSIDTSNVYPIEQTDYYFDDGVIKK